MHTLRQFVALIASIAAAVAEMAVTAPKMVWRAGRWVLESVTPTRRMAPPAGGGSADLAASLAEAATAPVASPAALTAAPAPQADVSLDEAAIAWGRIAKAFAVSQASPDAAEPDMTALDDAAVGWLYMLKVPELLAISNANPKAVGLHMFGKRDLPGVSICPTQEEYEAAKRIKAEARAAAQARTAEGRQHTADVLQDLIDNPTWAPAHAA